MSMDIQYKFRSFEEEYDSRVIIQTFEKIMNALEKGDYGMANSLVKFLDSSMVFMVDMTTIITNKDLQKIIKRIEKYRERDDDLKDLKIDAEINRQILKGYGFKELDTSFVLWHKLYSKWLRDLVMVLYLTNKLGSKKASMFIEE